MRELKKIDNFFQVDVTLSIISFNHYSDLLPSFLREIIETPSSPKGSEIASPWECLPEEICVLERGNTGIHSMGIYPRLTLVLCAWKIWLSLFTIIKAN